MPNIVYLKRYVIDENCSKIKRFFKKCIFMYKNFFNIITRKNIDGFNIWFLNINNKYTLEKLNKIFKKIKKENNIYVLEKELNTKEICNSIGIKIYNNEYIKKLLLKQIIEYIIKIKKVNLNELELTILVNDDSLINYYLIKELAISVKEIKIVSRNIYKFKELENNLWNKYGIAVQFSNSYKKSLLKSRLIIDLDFNEIEINEYKINHEAIIINCAKENLKIKNRFFNGVVVNSCEINLNEETIKKYNIKYFKNEFDDLNIYGSILIHKGINEALKAVDNDKICIYSLIGNNGKLCKQEFIKNT